MKYQRRGLEIFQVSRGVQGAERGGARGSGGLDPLHRIFFYYLISKWSIFGAVFKLDLTEETRTQLQLSPLASFWLRG